MFNPFILFKFYLCHCISVKKCQIQLHHHHPHRCKRILQLLMKRVSQLSWRRMHHHHPHRCKRILQVTCNVCHKQIDLLNMRTHIGVHILKGNLNPSCCGFCGKGSCQNMLVDSTKGRGKQFYKITSNCDYKVEWNKRPQYSTRNHCSNLLSHCTVCKASIWTYNMQNHYETRHPDFEDVPTFVSEEEIQHMKNKKM